MMRVLDLFSGIGGFSLGLERAGMRTVAFCEIDPFCRAVLRKHWPDVSIFEDVKTYQFSLGEAEVITGGFPCQDVSLAGKCAGLSGERSGLYRELIRAIRVVRPWNAIMENVAALLSDGMGTVLGDLAESRCDAEWDCVPACAVGSPHERDRVWIITHVAGKSEREQANETNAIATFWNTRLEPSGVSESPWTSDAPDLASEQVGSTGQSRLYGSLEPSSSYTTCNGCGQGRHGRPPDSFARIRDEARRNAADPYGARLAFREGITRDAWEERQTSQRNNNADERESIWPDEPALQGVDDGIPNWMDRVKATGNAIVPQIAELIGRAIMQTR